MARFVLAFLITLSSGVCLATEPVAIVGDSFTADTLVTSTWDVQLARRMRYRTFVVARGCQTAGGGGDPCFGLLNEGAAVTYMPALNDMIYTYIIVLLGTNDHGRGVELNEFRYAYDTLIHLKPDVTPICVIPPPSDYEDSPNKHGFVLDDYRQVIREVCVDGIVVETEDAMSLGTRYYRDGLHFTQAGHTRLRRRIMEVLTEALPK
jgi:lysophospholipase L1-like esterase